ALGFVALLYRARVGYLVELERQRTRIAMDLHDQVGSGLASVGILSGVIASDGLDAEERLWTAREIADVAEELGHSLSDIVWALDPQTASLEELSARLREHGERLFPDDGIRFEARLPERWPPVTSSMAVRRSVLLIGLEALHNAARHAQARRVTLRIQPRGRGWWDLAVQDDGSGMAPRDGTRRNGGSGRGLASMASRAEAIGARLAIDSKPSRGTTVTLSFHPQEGAVAGVGDRLAESMRSFRRMIMRGHSSP
ncbi:MAG TPA: ATP-binding protein, partial [Longimicrobiales bacterium]|nr:ATP-binding protein [Longimicrobiales bacterium]